MLNTWLYYRWVIVINAVINALPHQVLPLSNTIRYTSLLVLINMVKSRRSRKSHRRGSPPKVVGTESAVGPPRFDRYMKCLFRLYEPLILLRQLGQARGPRLEASQPRNESETIRRRFLMNLAFMCDYDKGGPTTTALAVEDKTDSYIFWVAVNDPDSESKTINTIERIIGLLRLRLHSTQDQLHATQDQFIKKCINNSQCRIKKERSMLYGQIKKLYLSGSPSQGKRSFLCPPHSCDREKVLARPYW